MRRTGGMNLGPRDTGRRDGISDLVGRYHCGGRRRWRQRSAGLGRQVSAAIKACQNDEH